MNRIVLVTGGSGLLGRHLCDHLVNKGYEIRVLSRTPKPDNPYQYYWNPTKLTMDDKALDGVTDIVHLAGAPIFKKWSPAYKQTIIDSRTQGIETLKRSLIERKQKVINFVSASGIGIYKDSYELQDENSEIGLGFVADVCRYWEIAAETMLNVAKHISKCRIGIVLSNEGGALEPMLKVSKLGLGSAIGNGKQIMPWIHIDDAVGIIAHILEHNMEGIFNTVAPNPVSNSLFMKTLAKTIKKPVLAPKVPQSFIKLVLGERASLVLGSSNISSNKILDNGYRFAYPNLNEALKNVTKQ